MIVEVDWTDRPVMRATSIFDSWPEAARERQDQPLVVQAHARLVGAAGVGGRRRYRRRALVVQRRHRDSCRGFPRRRVTLAAPAVAASSMPRPRSLRLACKRRSAASIINQTTIIILDSRFADGPNGARRRDAGWPTEAASSPQRCGVRRGKRRRAPLFREELHVENNRTSDERRRCGSSASPSPRRPTRATSSASSPRPTPIRSSSR